MDKIYQLKDELLLTEKDEMLYVLDYDNGRIHRFNQSAKVIFQLCLEPRTFAEIVREYRAYFDLGEPEAVGDVAGVLQRLASYELFKKGGGPLP